GLVRPAEERQDAQQREHPEGNRDSLFGAHNPSRSCSRMKTACHERLTALRPKSTSIGTDKAVASASAAVRTCAASCGRCGHSQVLTGAGSTPVMACTRSPSP